MHLICALRFSQFLSKDLKNNAAAEEFKAECLNMFPYMNAFGASAPVVAIIEEEDSKSEDPAK
jgi:hypothetical protein